MKSNFATWSDDCAAAVAAIRPHFLPFVRSLDSRTLETDWEKKPFSVSAGLKNKGLSLSVTGGTITAPITLWERHLGRYIETNGSTDISLYRDCGPLGSYLVVCIDLFFQHLRGGGACECFGRSTRNLQDTHELIQPYRGS